MISPPDLVEDILIYTTCPPSTRHDPEAYPAAVAQAARWTEQAGGRGMLVYTDNRLFDPWAVAHLAIAVTERLVPLVALQPLYFHPFAAANIVGTLGAMLGRAPDINLVAGGFPLDLVTLGDQLDHDDRYARLAEYGQIMRRLLEEDGRVSVDGSFYRVTNARLPFRPSEELSPFFFVSGSSEAGRACARAVGATPIMYPEPLPAGAAAPTQLGEAALGMRIGIIARSTAAEAWQVALERFPDDRVGREAQRAVTALSDSEWHHRLSANTLAEGSPGTSVYWLGPYRTYQTFCPYLVGSNDQVIAYLRAYLANGTKVVILDEPVDLADLEHAVTCLRLASASIRATRDQGLPSA